ncbi:MAG: alpha/beta hydrolase [Bacteriovorax sp.]|nr:alpha/beta hydrolase [Bacteriovorax sp.]
MKTILLNAVSIILVASCSFGTSKHEDISLPLNLPVTQPVSTVVVPPVIEITNIDEEFQKSLKPIWVNYFKEDYTDSRSLDIFVATNRKFKNKNFGCTNNQFGVDIDTSAHFGICKINVPKNHSTGQVTLTRDNRQSSHDFFKILNSKSLSEQSIIEILKKTKRTPLVFVHGFNVRFEDAVLRAAQITYDLKYQGPVVLFSWPAGAGDGFFDDKMITKTYESNLKNAKGSIEFFKSFLNNLKTNDLKINLVVHSMGHQVILPALKEFSEEEPVKAVINELILNAPDFEANEFIKLIENIKETSKRITLYCSYNDKAMVASESYNKTERLGACTFSENLDTINVSLIDAPTMGLGLGHSYYASRAILGDVFQVLLGIEAEKRMFIRKSEPNSTEKFYLRP